VVGDTVHRNCPLCGDNNWSEVEQSLYLPRAQITGPGFGLYVKTFVCGTCDYVLLMQRPDKT